MKTQALFIVLAMILMAASAFRFQSRMQTQLESQAQVQSQSCMNCALGSPLEDPDWCINKENCCLTECGNTQGPLYLTCAYDYFEKCG